MYKTKKYDKIFIKLAKDFMNEKGFELQEASFCKLQDDIYSEIYLRWEEDKISKKVTFDIVHYVYPLIYNYDFNGIFTDTYRDESHFSVSEISRKAFIADKDDNEDISSVINVCFLSFLEIYPEFFNILNISDYANKYIELCNSKNDKYTKMECIEPDNSSGYGFDFIYVLFYLERYDECIKELDWHIEYWRRYIAVCDADDISYEKYNKHCEYLINFKKALIDVNEEFISKKRTELFKNIEENKKIINLHLK